MKNLFKLSTTILLACILHFNASANASKMLTVYDQQSTIVLLQLDANAKGATQVKIVTDNGQTIFAEEVDSPEDQIRKYNLKELEKGYYTFQVEYNSSIKIQRFKKTFDEVILDGMDETRIFKPTIFEKEEGVAVNLLAFTGKFTIEVLDSENNVLHTEKHHADGSFGVLYDLRNLNVGTYTCRVYISDEDYTGSFEKKVQVNADIASL